MKLGRRSEQRAKAANGCLGLLFGGALMAAMNGYIVMIGMGVAHSWIPAIPTIGFWGAVMICLTVRTLLSQSTAAKTSN
jgi:hypothetical protein